MKETRYIADPKQPYGLHDKIINKIEIIDNEVTFQFPKGLFDLKIRKDVKGEMKIQGADLDFCEVILLNDEKFQRLSFKQLMEKYPSFEFEVVSEYYGWHRLILEGYLEGNEAFINIGYFAGDIIYITEE